MIKTRFRPIYLKPGKTNLQDARNRSGVYLIKEDEKIVYIGYSGSNLYKTITRHFQKWEDEFQVRVTYDQNERYSVRIVYCDKKTAKALEFSLILKHQPRDNPNKYSAYKEFKKLKNYEKVIKEFEKSKTITKQQEEWLQMNLNEIKDDRDIYNFYKFFQNDIKTTKGRFETLIKQMKKEIKEKEFREENPLPF